MGPAALGEERQREVRRRLRVQQGDRCARSVPGEHVDRRAQQQRLVVREDDLEQPLAEAELRRGAQEEDEVVGDLARVLELREHQVDEDADEAEQEAQRENRHLRARRRGVAKRLQVRERKRRRGVPHEEQHRGLLVEQQRQHLKGVEQRDGQTDEGEELDEVAEQVRRPEQGARRR